jgi:hypothetical protein
MLTNNVGVVRSWACSAFFSILYALALQVAHAEERIALSGVPSSTVAAGSYYHFRPILSGDTSGARPWFRIEAKPAWASFEEATGALSGTPTQRDIGTTRGIRIWVWAQGAGYAPLPPFSITVKGGAAPTIGGSPATTVTAGSAYAFSPTTTDPGNEALAFSIQNKPDWASFSIASGTLSGTPSSSETGVYGGIVISVSDGKGSVALPAFAIAVKAPVTGSGGAAALNWTAPSTNTNGTALTDLAGFYIYYGSSAAALTESIQLPNPTQTSYTFSSLPTGTWYFGVVAYTSEGTQSGVSGIAQMTIP